MSCARRHSLVTCRRSTISAISSRDAIKSFIKRLFMRLESKSNTGPHWKLRSLLSRYGCLLATLIAVIPALGVRPDCPKKGRITDTSVCAPSVMSFEKKFVSAVEEQLLLTSDETKLPQGTYERMKDTLSHLCYHYGRQPGGENLRNSWQKVRAPDEPQDVSLPPNHVH